MPRRRPPKTKKGATKRFKITATGKVMRYGAGKRHLNTNKSAKHKRKLGRTTQVHESMEHHILNVLPFGHRG